MAAFPRLKLSVPEVRRWLPAVVLVLCLSMFGMIGITMFSVGADPQSGPSALPTSTAAQGYQGLRRLLVKQGHAVSTNRLEDGGEGTQPRNNDIEIITLNQDGGLFSRNLSVRPEPSHSSSSSAASAPVNEPSQTLVPDTRRVEHVLYNPLGRVVIVVAPKWVSGPARTKPRWGSDPQPIPQNALRRMLMVLSPVSEAPSPNAGYDEDSEDAEWITVKAPAGKEVYDDGQTLRTYDAPQYSIRQSRTQGAVVLRAVPGQTVFTAPLTVGKVTDLQSITGPNLTPVLLGPGGEVVISRVRVTEGRRQPVVPVYLISDPDLLNNQILADPRKVIAALTIVNALAPSRTRPSVVFNLTFNNLSVDRDLLHALSRPPYLGVTLSLIVLGLGLTWAAFSRFGPPAQAVSGPALGRGVRVLADNAARIMAIAMKESKLGPAYAQMIRDEVLKSRGHRLGRLEQSPDELADRIGRLYGARETYTDLKAGAATILTVHQLIDHARRLHAWREEIGQSEIERAYK